MSLWLHIPASLQATVVLSLNVCLFAIGSVLLILPTTVRQDLRAFKGRYFPIYPEGRPTSGSTGANYFPTHLNTSDNAAQIALGAVTTLYGGLSTLLLYMQCLRQKTDARSSLEKVVAWVGMTIAGGATAAAAAISAALSFGGNSEGSGVDLKSVGYWPWKNMFPTIQWSVEGWTCAVYTQLDLGTSTKAEHDFAQMCHYSRISKWLTLVLLLLGFAAMTLGISALMELKRSDRREIADLRVEALRDSEKSGKEP